MESLSYTFTDHTDFQADDHFPKMTRESFLNNQLLLISCDDTNSRSIISLNSTSAVTLKSVMGFETGFSSFTNDDGRFSVVSIKRTKITNLPCPVPTCQVLGCNKDLSNSKDYHKRHKVCDVHSKTSVVIVNGFEQRFCQQCSSYLTNNTLKTSLIFPSVITSDDIVFEPRCNKPINNHSMKFSQSFPISQSRAKHCLNTPSSVQNPLLVGSNSSYAPSLLSPQSTPHPLISEKNYHSNLPTLQNSAKPYFTPMSFNASGVDQGLPLGSDEISQNIIDAVGRNSCPFPEVSKTVDLAELSLHLQRVEQQKYSGQVKLENRVFCNLANT